MKKFRMRDHYNEKYREYIIGSAQTDRHGVYLVYGELEANGKRDMAPEGHDEILYLLDGEALLTSNEARLDISGEDAVPLDPKGSYTLAAKTGCRYLVAGSHITPHHH